MIWVFVAAAVIMWLLQGLLSAFQLKKFNRELKTMRQSGRVAIGKARGRFRAGCLLLLCIDADCRIVKGRLLQGITSFANFRDFNSLNGIVLTDIDESTCAGFDKQTAKAILSAVDEYRQYTAQQAEKQDDSTCASSPK